MNTVSIKGMSCEHCVKAVTEALEEIGLKDVRVSLADGTAVFAETGIDPARLREAIDDAGFVLAE